MTRTTGDAVWTPCISTTHIGEYAIWPIAGERLSRTRSQLGIFNPRGFIITIIIIIIVIIVIIIIIIIIIIVIIIIIINN